MTRRLFFVLLAASAATLAPREATTGEHARERRFVFTAPGADGAYAFGFAGEEGPVRKKRGYLGVSVLDLNESLRAHFGAPKDAGVLVSEVHADSPAAKAGIAIGDVLVRVGETAIDDRFDLGRVIGGKKAGDEAAITVVRDRRQRVLTAALAEREKPQLELMLGHLPDKIVPFDSEELREEIDEALQEWRRHEPHVRRFEDLRRFEEIRERAERRQRDLEESRDELERRERDLERTRERLERRVHELEQKLEELEKRLQKQTA